VTGGKEELNEEVPFQSVDEILERRRGGDLFRYLIEKFASFSGISGVQPKVFVRDG
jgi:serine/threonine-protein kinase HipA